MNFIRYVPGQKIRKKCSGGRQLKQDSKTKRVCEEIDLSFRRLTLVFED